MTYDPVDKLSRFAKRRKIKYPVLADPKSEVIRAFGLLNQDYPPGSYAHGVAHPMIVVFDADGIVTHRFSRGGYVRRPNIDAVLAQLRNAQNPASADNSPASDETPPVERSFWKNILRRL